MPVTAIRPSGAEALDAIRQRLEGLAALGRERDQAERTLAERRLAARQAHEAAAARLRAELERPAGPDRLEQDLADLRGAHERRLAALAALGQRHRRDLREAAELAVERLADAPPDEAESIAQQMAAGRRRAAFAAALKQQRARAAALVAALHRTAERSGCAPPAAEAAAAAAAPAADPEAALDAQRIQLDWQEERLAQATARSGIARIGGIAVAATAIVLPHAAAIAACIWALRQPAWGLWAGLSLAVCLIALAIAVAVVRRRLSASLAAVASGLAPIPAALARIDAAGRAAFDPGAPIQRRVGQILSSDAAQAERAAAIRAGLERDLARAKQRELALRQRLVRRLAADERALREAAHAAGAGRIAGLEARLAAADAELERALAGLDADAAEGRRRFAAQAAAWLAETAALGAAQAADLRRRHPAWDDAGAWAAWQPPADWGSDAPIGGISGRLGDLVDGDPARLGLDAEAILRFPLALAYPGLGSLLLRAAPDRRDAALRILADGALRALAGFPPGRVRLTLIDPLGLGQSFARLLDLGEHDEAVLAGGVLADGQRIERGLDDLCAHLEKVIQKHLRGRYATLDDYNREAGELQEPMRLVLIADFPAGFGERALERLGVLLKSGARCGVHVLIQHDDRQALPAGFDLGWFRRIGLVGRQVRDRLMLDREGMHAFAIAGEPEPPAELARALTAAIGRGALAAKRVAVAFAAIAPPAEQVWSASTAESLRLPIGKRGADRLQYLELGRGTAQHVLVGGRTGSGKSTLFHVMIASAALWFHPRELELHLIDFKKGVEFKAYATHRLPHAKVVAIESDREFGLSVLRQLDGELTRRGELFRRAGAQDLAAHRRGGGEHLPRILLIIDEFQELFTEDDAIARDAALLLDRFVRQGRAFGVHVILGSQTLAGSYSLAKSSLGQMGVRIVLPCNEADAHLLLHEENDAARLLSRPGDAIYNDRAGLVDGNSPFQVCWLSDREEAEHLAAVAERVRADGWRGRRQVVFEGDSPARIEDEPELMDMLARPWAPADARARAWLGQASSLRGAAEAVLPAAGGGNLLIVGQHREAAAATCAAILLGLAARHPPAGIRLAILDGDDADGPAAAVAARLAARLPHAVERHEARGAAALVADLAAELERRQAGGSHPLLVLTVFALQRLRALRPDDDGALGRGTGEPPGEAFARILANGPEFGIHVIAWCDSLGSLQRGLGRRALRDFDQRLCFQMSAADSSELIDDDAASRLGLHTALLAAQADGRREKLRPYRLPDDAVLDRIGTLLRQRFPG